MFVLQRTGSRGPLMCLLVWRVRVRCAAACRHAAWMSTCPPLSKAMPHECTVGHADPINTNSPAIGRWHGKNSAGPRDKRRPQTTTQKGTCPTKHPHGLAVSPRVLNRAWGQSTGPVHLDGRRTTSDRGASGGVKRLATPPQEILRTQHGTRTHHRRTNLAETLGRACARPACPYNLLNPRPGATR